MACCSKSLEEKSQDVLIETEVEDILSKDTEMSPNLREKPLSPILSGGLSNRKFLMGRRFHHKKSSRVRLSDRFKKTDTEEHVNPVNVCIPISLDDSLSFSQTSNLVDQLDKLEELENNRKNLYKIFVRDNKQIDNNFKIPELPKPIKNEKINNIKTNLESNQGVQVIPLPPKNLMSGFQTARGKDISISVADISKHSKLFGDIICATQNFSEGRRNKHTFLKKVGSVAEKSVKSPISIQINNDAKLTIQSKSFQDLSAYVGSNISEKVIQQGIHFFDGEDFKDIELNRKDFCGFKKANVEKCVNFGDFQKINNDKILEISFAQAISEISNTQMSHAVDKLLESIENKKDEFKGFIQEEVNESYAKFKKFKEFFYFVNRDDNVMEEYRNTKGNKHPLENYPLPPMKRFKRSEPSFDETSIIANENNLFIINNNIGGFTSASGKSIKISEQALKDAGDSFKDIDSCPPLKIAKQKLQNISFSNNADLMRSSSFIGFHKASGKSVVISEDSLQKAKYMFDKLDVEIQNQNLDVLGRAVPIESNVLNEKYIEKACFSENRNEFCKEHTESENINPSVASFNNFSNSVAGFCKASGKAIKVSECAIKKAKRIFDNLNENISSETLVGEVCTSISKTIPTGHKSVQKTNLDLSVQDTVCKKNVVEKLMSFTTPILNTSLQKTESTRPNKRKLGVSHCKQIQISDNKLNKAKLLFDEDFIGTSTKPREITTYTSTPVKQNIYSSTVCNGSQRPMKRFSDFIDSAGITPIKNVVEIKREENNFGVSSKILCTSPTGANWLDDLEMERKKLESRLQVLLEREKLGKKMIQCLEMGKQDHDRKPRKGLLYRNKTTSNRISLTTLVNTESWAANANVGLLINPKTAENLHFKEQLTATIVTKDGAIVIPNSKDMVGLFEIEKAFEAMPGIDPRLIPKKWIRNHFKWIVWKLSSYEIRFPNYFDGYLNIENVIQQLKYRYDREIDRAERSALRKIYEKDDAPQKRMILCVSNIKMVDDKKYELELNDGWYSIRTIIDDSLCNQIIRGKIKIGTKLVISGAELLNCDGCHPLEATDFVRLKINCNSTRRALWHLKLGFQSNPNPFPIQLDSIYPFGGTIGAIKVCIVRVYPMKYKENLESRSVWRNKKAEEISAQKWESHRCKKLEQIQDEVRKKFKNSCIKPIIGKSYIADISSIRCPIELHDILERSNDPDCLQQNLSASQKESVLNYQNILSMKKQDEIAAEINESASKMQLMKRDVVAVLKLLIIDIIKNSDRPLNFFIWRPTEAHLQILREGTCFTIQNVFPRPNGDLNSSMKTTFRMESVCNNKYSKYKRCLIQLEELVSLKSSPVFNEFDTIGIIVQIKIESFKQEIWLTDIAGRLLSITIYEGPSTCLLLDNLKRGQATTICNLVYRGLMKDIVQAVANHFTVFSSYSQHRHLQEGLEVFKKKIPKDIQHLLNDCDNKIEVFKICSDLKNSFSSNFNSGEDTL